MIKPEQLASSLERGLAPVYLIAGEEPLLLQECCDQVRAAAREQGFAERELLRVEKGFDWSLLQQAAAPSLFATRKVIDLRIPSGKPGREGAAALVDWAEAPDPDILLLVSCENWDTNSRKAKWAARLGKAGQRVDIWPVKPRQLKGWLQQRMRAQGMEPSQDAIAVLADRVEGNLLAAQQEIDRLALLKGGGRVGVEEVMQAVSDSSRFDAFLLADYLLTGNLQAALRVTAGLRRMDTPIPMLLGALLKEFRQTEACRLALRAGEQEAVVFRRLNIWPQKQPQVRAAVRRLDTLQWFKAFRLLALIDRQCKGRADGDPWESLDALALQLARG
ncbi:MAG: DNA polymerase III subunit delta [Lysobacterales bacterium]|jgi:DNA polymerase-3 subunit delta